MQIPHPPAKAGGIRDDSELLSARERFGMKLGGLLGQSGSAEHWADYLHGRDLE